MSKISLVSRRKKTPRQDAPATRASERARQRVLSEEKATEKALGTLFRGHKRSFSIKDGIPSVELQLPADDRITLQELAEEYMTSTGESRITINISKETRAGSQQLRLQFLPAGSNGVITAKQLAIMMGVSVRTVHSLRRSGEIKGRKAGNSWQFAWRDVLNVFEKEMGE